LFQQEKITLGTASQFASMNQLEWLLTTRLSLKKEKLVE